jgi:peptide deformylase
MAILKILTFEQSLLKKKAKNIKAITLAERKLLKDMVNTMYDAKGVGLAAIQVGILKRIFIVDIGEGVQFFINPKIIKKTNQIISREGCLSVPRVQADVKRFDSVTIKALDEKGKSREVKAEGLFARAIQHELDHLDGILIIDRAEKPEDIHYSEEEEINQSI